MAQPLDYARDEKQRRFQEQRFIKLYNAEKLKCEHDADRLEFCYPCFDQGIVLIENDLPPIKGEGADRGAQIKTGESPLPHALKSEWAYPKTDDRDKITVHPSVIWELINLYDKSLHGTYDHQPEHYAKTFSYGMELLAHNQLPQLRRVLDNYGAKVGFSEAKAASVNAMKEEPKQAEVSYRVTESQINRCVELAREIESPHVCINSVDTREFLLAQALAHVQERAGMLRRALLRVIQPSTLEVGKVGNTAPAGGAYYVGKASPAGDAETSAPAEKLYGSSENE